MNGELKSATIDELKKARDTWNDLPSYVYTDEYEAALMGWIGQCVEHGRNDVKNLVLYALDHETGGKEPYFPFNRKK